MDNEDKAAFTILTIIASIFPLGIIGGVIVAVVNSVNGC